VIPRLAVPAIGLAMVAAAGCSSGPAATSGTSAPATSTAATPLPTVTPPDATCGRLQIRVLGVQGGRPVIVGTHAEFPSRAGQFVRVRIYATNEDGVFHTFHALQSPVVDAGGTTTLPSREGMLIKRQSEDVVLGGENQAQFDLWYDLPTTARPVTVVLRQDLDCARPMPLPAMTRS
jgi:hypothetical protein